MSDLIKRSDAIKAVSISCGTCLARDMEDCEKCSVPKLRELINAIPSADRPQGKWIRDRYWSRGVGMGEEYGFFYKCSMCEYEVESGYTRCGFNYCPYCGADMRGDRRWEMK